MKDRHHLTFDTYEEGKLTLDEYLGRVVFYRKRPFTRLAKFWLPNCPPRTLNL
jgi:putative hydrolase of the HAD superfamily